MAETFTEFCEQCKVSPDERMKLARYLATLRAEATLKLGKPSEICHCPCCKAGTEAPHEYHLEHRPMAVANGVVEVPKNG